MIGYLYASPIAVLKFDPALEGVSYNDYIIYLPIKPEQNVSTGFTICLRTKFDTLESKCIFEAERDLSFRLHDFRWDGGGGIIHADAMLRRVVERPGPVPWPVLGRWRQGREG